MFCKNFNGESVTAQQLNELTQSYNIPLFILRVWLIFEVINFQTARQRDFWESKFSQKDGECLSLDSRGRFRRNHSIQNIQLEPSVICASLHWIIYWIQMKYVYTLHIYTMTAGLRHGIPSTLFPTKYKMDDFKILVQQMNMVR